MPALLIELKKGKSAKNTLKQIKNRKYSEKVSQYTGDMLLIGINYL
jgi:predicted negative regulator of RcsB-dependent stress response